MKVETLNEYQRLALITANHDLDSKIDLAVASLGVAGEAGEVADHVKKYLGHGHELDREKMIKECGDVLWYVSKIAHCLDVSLQEIAERNIEKLAKRYPEGFSEEASKNRKE